jgi:ubiquinone/menaquinone biosynthesis C-methylase UbiE
MSTERFPPRALTAFLLLAACGQAPAPAPRFPAANRPVATIVSPRFSTESQRDAAGEAALVMDRAATKPGMSVADIGAGEGYYTVRLAKRVGASGRVLAEDVMAETRDQLAQRVARGGLDNVSVKLGEPADPKLPDDSFDQIYLIHMYHEIQSPYELLWRLRPALRAGGRLVIVDADRPTANHGTPPAQLDCELRAVGYALERREVLKTLDAYLALYKVAGPRPAPEAIKAC